MVRTLECVLRTGSTNDQHPPVSTDIREASNLSVNRHNHRLVGELLQMFQFNYGVVLELTLVRREVPIFPKSAL